MSALRLHVLRDTWATLGKATLRQQLVCDQRAPNSARLQSAHTWLSYWKFSRWLAATLRGTAPLLLLVLLLTTVSAPPVAKRAPSLFQQHRDVNIGTAARP